MVRYCLFVMTCCLVSGCSSETGTGPESALDVYEAVFRYQMDKSPADTSAYLSVDGKDPPEELIARLNKDWPNLKPLSKQPQEKGRLIYADSLKRAGSKVVVKAGSWFPTKFGGEGHFADHHLARKNGKWVVEKLENETSS